MSAIASCHADRQFDIAPKVNVANSISSNAPTKPAWVNEQFGKTIPRDFAIAAPSVWCGELGATLEGETIRLRVAGKQGAPSVLVLGGISGDRFVSDDAERKGWWSDIVRSGGDIDLDRYQVISIDLFPLAPQQVLDLTTADYAQLIHHALTTIGNSHLHAFIGSSYFVCGSPTITYGASLAISSAQNGEVCTGCRQTRRRCCACPGVGDDNISYAGRI